MVLLLWGLCFYSGCHKQHMKIIDLWIQCNKIVQEGDPIPIDYYWISKGLDPKVDIIFSVVYFEEYTEYASLLNLGNQCYANAQDKWIVDEIIEDSYSLSFDNEFIFNGDTINANKNLFEIDQIVAEMDLYNCRDGSCRSQADLIINFSDFFIANSEFNDSIYAVTFSCETSYGLVIEDTYRNGSDIPLFKID